MASRNMTVDEMLLEGSKNISMLISQVGQEFLSGNDISGPSISPTGGNVGDTLDAALKVNDNHQGQPNLNRKSSKTGAIPKDKQYKRNSKCKICQRPDTMEMVACDDCYLWFHYSCAGVDDTIADKPWKCPKCAIPSLQLNGAGVPPPTSIGRTTRSRSKSTALARLEEQRKLDLKIITEERRLREECNARYIAELRESESRFIDSKLSIHSGSDTSSISEKRLSTSSVNNWVADQQAHIESHRQADLNNVQRKGVAKPTSAPPTRATRGQSIKSVVQNDPINLGGPNSIGRPRQNHTDLKLMNPFASNAAVNFLPALSSKQQPPKAASATKDMNCTYNISSRYDPLLQNHSSRMQVKEATPENHSTFRYWRRPQDLPEFSGSEGEWPMFISAYTQSTLKYDLTDDDNMERLRKALKGKARKLVIGRLASSTTVRSVIDTLFRNFGRPDIIIDELIEKVRRQPSVKFEKLEQLMELSAAIEDLCAMLENSMLDNHLNNPTLLREVILKLPPQLQMSWSFYTESMPDADLLIFNEWLISYANAASRVPKLRVKEDASELKVGKRKLNRVNHHDVSNERAGKEAVLCAIEKTATTNDPEKVIQEVRLCCVCGSENHTIEKCDQFIKLSNRNRWGVVDAKKLCRTCLRRHRSRCLVSKVCGVDGCLRYHHAMLHKQNFSNVSSSTSANVSETDHKKQSASASVHHHHGSDTVLYRIVPVILYGRNKCAKTFAFIDEGSSVTLLEEQMAKDLDLTGPQTELCLRWTADVIRVEENSQIVDLNISGIQSNNEKYRMYGVSTVKRLELPVQTVSPEMLSQYKHLDQVPIDVYVNGRPTILIGLDQYKMGLPLQIKEGNWDEPMVAKTRLGWTIYGGRKTAMDANRVNIHRCDCKADFKLHELVKHFFSLESFGVGAGKILESKDDIRAKQIMARTTKHNGNKFETGLLWKFDQIRMPESRSMAIRRLVCFEKKLRKEPRLQNVVNDKIQEYVEKNYASKLTGDKKICGQKTWYLPIFSVCHPNKPSKVRIVWDAAAKSNGTSLNDLLLKGPDNLKLLPEILYRFRQKRYAITGDIREMFHQVEITPSDCDAQRFLWRNCDETKEPDEYVMRVMTFGASCSPSLAQYIKNLNADRFTEEYPRAVIAIKDNHYVDDWLDAFDSSEEAVGIAKQVRKVHAAAGFEIRNWLSNDGSILRDMGESDVTPEKRLTCLEESADKVLGMWWCTKKDVLTFRINSSRFDKAILEGTKIPTKRQVLSAVMSIFDPLGLISAYVVHGKIILQSIWSTECEWDEKINNEQFDKWCKWLKRLYEIEKLQIPRCYLQTIDPANDNIKYDLHVFVDAGMDAYAAAAYLRANRHGRVECALVSSKTRVSPRKPTSIPRLELMAAVLGVRLMQNVLAAHTLTINSKTMWSDSSTVLSWLKSDSRKYKQFVSFRISECLESTEVHEWRYVPSKMNVADEATKWYPGAQLSSGRWFTGPQFLLQNSEHWPKNICRTKVVDEELRSHLSHASCIRNAFLTPIICNLSSWDKIVRTQVYINRAIRNFKAKGKKLVKGPILYEEFRQAEYILFRKAQWDAFKDEVATLMHSPNSCVRKSSSIYNYSPYLDVNGVLRMKGRIDKFAGNNVNIKRPIILPKVHEISYYLVKHYHCKFFHRHHETAINEIRQRFAIPKLRVLCRRIRSECQKCKLLNAKPEPPEMGPLPADRLQTHIKPFSNVGVDYFGPMEVTVGRRVEKRWGVLYTCLSVRAIHMEIVNSLTTNSCIRSLVMFMARRGTPRRVYSDNGTNFHGANRALQAELKNLKADELVDRFTNIEWRFIPPRSPHVGGCWERLVRTVKTILYDVLPERKPNEEILRACLAEIESIVNSRPLTHIPIEDEEAEALTPNHFIHGNSSGYKPLCESEENDMPSYHSWKISQLVAKKFWRRFIKEYMPDLARKTKWYEPVSPLAIGDLVFVCDEKNERGHWPRGKVIDVCTGQDNQVRSAVVQTSSGIYTRPASKLAKIDVTKAYGQESLVDRENIDKGVEC